MFRLLVTFAIAFLFVHAKADEDCICQEYTDEEKQQIWDFLQRISGEMSDEEGILPALLAPIVPCGNCLDGLRKKRTVLPPVDSDNDEEDVMIVRADSRCPIGYGRIAFRCIRLSDLYKKK